MQPKNVAIRKRTQIASANRVMFMWVAAVSVVVGISLVGAMFLTQILFFNEKVLSEKEKTVKVLSVNYNNITKDDGLEAQVRILNTNQALINSKAKADDQALQVILDALPSDANSLALGASLQNKLLAGINGLTLNSLQVDPVVGVESLSDDNTVVNASSSRGDVVSEIQFRFSVNGDEAALTQVLKNLERSIRTIDIISLKIESQGSTRMMTVQGRAFYEPARKVELIEKTVNQ